MYTNIEIGNFDDKTAAKIKSKLHGKSYMNFQVICAPIGGELAVSVETNYEGTTEKIQGMLMFVMACEL